MAKKLLMDIGVLAVAASLFWASSAGAVQSRNSRSYLVGRRFTAAYVVRLQSAERSHTVVIPVSNSKNFCAALKKDDSAFRGDGDQWDAGCVSSLRDAVFVNPKGIPNAKGGEVSKGVITASGSSSS
jgi:hypothetical protein